MLQEEQLPAIRARSGFGWIYLRIARQFASETFTQKGKKQQQQQYKQFKFIVVSALFPARLIPSVTTLPVWSPLFSSQPIKRIKAIHSPRYHCLATMPLTWRQNDPGFGAL